MLGAVRNPKRLALVSGAFSIVLAMAILWFWSFPSPTNVSASLAPDDVRQIVRIVSKSRWKWVRWFVAKREFKSLRHFVLPHTYWIHGDSGATGKASVLYRGAFDSDKVFLNLFYDGTNGWQIMSTTFLQ
jgi:hypothetical protein